MMEIIKRTLKICNLLFPLCGQLFVAVVSETRRKKKKKKKKKTREENRRRRNIPRYMRVFRKLP